MTYGRDAPDRERQRAPAGLGPDDALEVGRAPPSGRPDDLRPGVDERLGQHDHVVVRSPGWTGSGVPAFESAAFLSDRQAAPDVGSRAISRRRRDEVGPLAASAAGGVPGGRHPSRRGPRPVRRARLRTAATPAPARRERCEPWGWRGGGDPVHRTPRRCGVACARRVCTDRGWGLRMDALWAPLGDRGKLLPPPYQDAARPARRAESCPSGGGAATEGTGVAASGEGRTGATPTGGRAADWGPAGGCAQYDDPSRIDCGVVQGLVGDRHRPARSCPTIGCGADLVRPGAVAVVAESTKAGRLPAHRRARTRPTDAHGDGLGSVQRSGSPPSRRRGHDGRSPRAICPWIEAPAPSRYRRSLFFARSLSGWTALSA